MNKRLLKIILRWYIKICKALGVLSNFEEFYIKEKKRKYLYTRLLGYVSLGYVPNLTEPKSFNEKLIHRRLMSRDPLWPIITDKVAVRDWITKQGLGNYVKLIPVLDIIDEPDHFNPADYEQPYIIKGAWASGKNIIVNKNEIVNFDDIKSKMVKWANEPYAVHRLIWASHQIPRRYIIEKLLLDDSNQPPKDYKFFVIHGRVELIQIHSDRFINQSLTHFNRDKEILDIKNSGKDNVSNELPEHIDKMISISEKISKNIDFARIDLYLHKNEIYFGEITLTPWNGFGGFEPVSYDFELGAKWKYDKNNPSI